jgi:hypothetical protein
MKSLLKFVCEQAGCSAMALIPAKVIPRDPQERNQLCAGETRQAILIRIDEIVSGIGHVICEFFSSAQPSRCATPSSISHEADVAIVQGDLGVAAWWICRVTIRVGFRTAESAIRPAGVTCCFAAD